jgi:hypothetical protein
MIAQGNARIGGSRSGTFKLLLGILEVGYATTAEDRPAGHTLTWRTGRAGDRSTAVVGGLCSGFCAINRIKAAALITTL